MSGRGPPCVFSGGMWNAAPKFMYSDVIRRLKQNFTVVTLSGKIDLTCVDELASSLGVDQMVLFAHSAFDPAILQSERLRGAVVCDPVSRPALGMSGVQSQTVQAACPVLTLRAGYLCNSSLPAWNVPVIAGDVTDEVLDGFGHTDLLDDTWANLASSSGIWQTVEPLRQSFEEWRSVKKDVVNTPRTFYRERLTQAAISFLLAKES